MAIHFKDLKERAKTIISEFRKQKMGIVGASIILFMLFLGIFAPWLAPNTVDRWGNVRDWRDNPARAPPTWLDYVTSDDYAPHEVVYDAEEEEGYFHEVTYTYQNDYDMTIRDIIIYLEGSYTGSDPELIIEIERPDGEVVGLIDRGMDASNGSFSSRISIFKDSSGQIFNYFENIAVDEGLPLDDVPQEVNVDEGRVLFAQKSKDMLTNPKSLKGEYVLRIMMYQSTGDIELTHGEDSTRVIYGGAVYGLMGTDTLRRDIMLGWIWGARYALIIGMIVAVATVSIGTLFGMTSAYFGGWTDEIMQRINEIVIGIPTLPIMIIIMFLLSKSLWIMIFLMSILYWRGIAKTIRARGLQIRQETYIEASEALGSGGGRIIINHMIPQILPYSVAEAALTVPIVIITEASLSLLGLGDPSIVTWGLLLSQAQQADATIQGLWWWVLLPGIGITLFGFAFIASGMAIERVVNPKMQQR